MNENDHLLQLAIEDNVQWCSTICNAHGADDDLQASPWFNLKPSPKYYPNIITRTFGSQVQVCETIERLRSLHIPKGWGIKDSFSDLSLDHLGFEAVINGYWFGGIPTDLSKPPAHWKKVTSIEALRRWEAAWGGDKEKRIFPDTLLNDGRIDFWFKTHRDEIDAGFICFRSDPSIGLSNWFSCHNQSIFDIGAFDVIGSSFPGVPLVFWSSDQADHCRAGDVKSISALKIWISKF
jgi:hypothetical protein